MNTINSKTKVSSFLVFLFLCLFVLLSCEKEIPKELTIKHIELCDNFDANVNCIEPKLKNGIVKLKPTVSKKEIQTWENFSNYLYFTARETPGFVVTFSRQLTESEKKLFSTHYAAYLSLDGVREKMEGFEIGKDKIASFHYLGSLLKEVKREKKIAMKKPNLDENGHLLLQFEFTLPNGMSSSLQREIKLEWEN